jgi:TetR/AcrR family transcriptional regulator, regulator of autoinduction and epiphytic fitness
MVRKSFREQMLRVREDAIVESVNRLLAEKGFELMTVDEVAADVGIAKASLYKHFPSKEALAAAAMVRVLTRAQDLIESLNADPESAPRRKLEAVVRWAITALLAGQMPVLPAQNSTLRSELMANKAYTDTLVAVSDGLGEWIEQAQTGGWIDPALPPELVLYTVFARACDPVPNVLKAGGQYSDAQIIEWVVGTCFDGLARATSAAAAPRREAAAA